ncbi:MAG: hypothetical protein Tsb0013_09000 [Phycisphaerales bacterium]
MAEKQRTLTAHAIIALGLVGAVQMLWVAPARESVEDARREISALQSMADDDPTASIADIEARERHARERAETLRNANTFADPARLVELVQRLGDEAGVVVHQINPKPIEPRTGLRQDDRRAQSMPTSGVVVTIEARGTYRDVTRFVTAIEGRPGYTRTDEISLRPSLVPGRDELGVTIRTAQLAFDPTAFNTAQETEVGG